MSSSMYPQTFPVAGPVRLSVRHTAGDLTVVAADVTEIVVDLRPSRPGDEEALEMIARTTVDVRGNAVRIDVPRDHAWLSAHSTPAIDIEVTVPMGSSVDAESGSADLRLEGELGAVVLKTGSGDIGVDHCADVRVRTGSGDVRLGRTKTIGAKSGSGDIRVEEPVGEVVLDAASGDIGVDATLTGGRVSSASGDIAIGGIAGRVEIKTASGDIAVRVASEGELTVKSASGDVSVGIPVGTAARLDVTSVSGGVHSQLDSSDAPAEADRKVLVSAQSISGSVTIARAE
ncbi:MAG TPA: DUF4097 family beta strand repeat-containing protein [Jiangellaceae bacterium]